jgi:hypothetical protein
MTREESTLTNGRVSRSKCLVIKAASLPMRKQLIEYCPRA